MNNSGSIVSVITVFAEDMKMVNYLSAVKQKNIQDTLLMN